MSYQIIPNIIFIFAVLGIVLIILRHLPEAKSLEVESGEAGSLGERELGGAGILKKTGRVIVRMFRAVTGKAWDFALEAKDLKPVNIAGQGLKQIFKEKPKSQDFTAAYPSQTITVPHQPIGPAVKPKDEKHYLDVIKQDPKNLNRYDDLGKYYIDNMKFEDSRDVYIYLINHHATNPTYHARLAYSFYRLKQFKRAADHYKRSLSLDSSQPNRYYNLGLTLDAHGDRLGSVESFEKAIALDSKNVKFYTTLANILIKYGMRDKARDILAKARTLAPSSSEILEKLNSLK